ncbi:MAG: transposase [Muribaculaceae bacterium]|nr:transposase [Muribaculaceae bacterium]
MNIKFNKGQRRHIRKFLRHFHGKEHIDLYKVFNAIAYLVYTGCQWKMLPKYYYPRPTTVYYHFRKWIESDFLIQFLHRKMTI